MNKHLLLLTFLLISVIQIQSFSQEKMPEVLTLSTQFERIEIIRMRSGTDLLEGLNKALTEKKIRNGVILAGIGSVMDYHFHVVTDRNLPPAQEFPKASTAMDLTSLQGYILNGKIHAHMTLSDENSMLGGHVEPGTKALTFFIITLGVLPDILSIQNFDNYKF